MFPGRLIIRIILCSLLQAGTLAWAQPSNEQQASALIVEANRLRTIGADQSAFPLVLKAYQIAPGPRTLVQLGMVESALGRWADADRHLTEALKAPDHPFIVKNADKIMSRLTLGKDKIGTVEVKGEPVGAEVLVNGSPAGTLPLPAPVVVNAGPADVEVRAPGYEGQSRNLTVAARTLHTVVMRLKAASAGQSAGMPVAAAAPYPGPGAGLAASADAGEAHGHDGWWWLRLGAATAAAGAAAVGGYAFYVRERSVDAFRSKQDSMRRGRCFEKGGTVVDADGKPAQRDCFDLRSQYRDAQTVMLGGLVAAGLLATGALALWAFGPDGTPERISSRPSAGTWSVALAPDGAWAGWKLRF